MLVAYATAGAGHRRAAEAIAEAAVAAWPGARVECRDILSFVPPGVGRLYPAIYYLLVRHFSHIWGACFQAFDTGWLFRVVQPLRHCWNLLLAHPFTKWVEQERFDVVIATHFMAADLFGSLRARGRVGMAVAVITDLHPHRFWLAPAIDVFVVGSDETAALCRARGVPAEKLRVLGIPTARNFHAPVDRDAILRRHGLDPARKTLLVTSGGTTVGPFEPVAQALLGLEAAMPGRLQLFIVCGENEAAARRLRRAARHSAMPAAVFAFTQEMAELMGASDIIVSKAGGLTVMEALSRGRPLVFYHAIPGQEEVNAQYVQRHGAAIRVRHPHEAVDAVRRLLEDRALYDRASAAARGLARPDAADRIVAGLMG